ncbi:hypothetical protein I7I50_00019 [Histoplasma capsulatum G186AR]|uniref:Uncharacterized protein n=1 Tax=Ajellomyces capsulatus TaxID=5037 RepID=A0A8H7YF40_AJECA|nr:hypothetical protein I7I52_07288 [Histoplasma capsulatum]QSS72229.1 hypothetical protein I7I50_00019 [Histoplasma capsulatum G186AR]
MCSGPFILIKKSCWRFFLSSRSKIHTLYIGKTLRLPKPPSRTWRHKGARPPIGPHILHCLRRTRFGSRSKPGNTRATAPVLRCLTGPLCLSSITFTKNPLEAGR